MGDKPHWIKDSKEYVFSRVVNNIGVQYYLMIDGNNKVFQVELILQSSKNFLSIKEQCKAVGYVLSSEQNMNDPLSSQYKLGNSAATFTSGKDEKLGAYYSVTFW